MYRQKIIKNLHNHKKGYMAPQVSKKYKLHLKYLKISGRNIQKLLMFGNVILYILNSYLIMLGQLGKSCIRQMQQNL